MRGALTRRTIISLLLLVALPGGLLLGRHAVANAIASLVIAERRMETGQQEDDSEHERQDGHRRQDPARRDGEELGDAERHRRAIRSATSRDGAITRAAPCRNAAKVARHVRMSRFHCAWRPRMHVAQPASSGSPQ